MAGVKLNAQGVPEGWPMHEAIELGPGRVKTMLDAGEELLLLDCRTDKEKAVASIDGSLFIPMQELPGRLSELEDYLDRKVVVFCHAGVRSMKVALFLRDRGFEDVWSMAGGIDLWSAAIDPSVPRY